MSRMKMVMFCMPKYSLSPNCNNTVLMSLWNITNRSFQTWMELHSLSTSTKSSCRFLTKGYLPSLLNPMISTSKTTCEILALRKMKLSGFLTTYSNQFIPSMLQDIGINLSGPNILSESIIYGNSIVWFIYKIISNLKT